MRWRWWLVFGVLCAASGCENRHASPDPDNWREDAEIERDATLDMARDMAWDQAMDAELDAELDAALPFDRGDGARDLGVDLARDQAVDAAPDMDIDMEIDAAVPDLGPVVECPDPRLAQVPARIAPGRWLDLVAPDWPEARYRWQILRAPADSTALMGEFPAAAGMLQPDDANTPTAAFFPDISGEYFIELIMTTPECRARRARFAVEAINLAGLHIELVWNTPGDPRPADGDGTDLDLHLLHPDGQLWNDDEWDCHYANPRPDWGQTGRRIDDPRLDVDDTDGEGPEHITIDRVEPAEQLGGPYLLSVNYFRAEGGQGAFGRSEAVIRIFGDGRLIRELRRDLIATGDRWVVAEIYTDPVRIVPVDQIITP